jgi:hypothetical protein
VKQAIHQKCIACGHESVLPKTLHKLTTYIINHPPDSTGIATYSAIAADAKGGATKADKPSKSEWLKYHKIRTGMDV